MAICLGRILGMRSWVFHAAFVAFVVLGMVAIVVGLALRRGWARNFLVPDAARRGHRRGDRADAGRDDVSLTVLENDLRRQAGQRSYPGDFIGYWAHRLIFFDAEPWVFTLAYTLSDCWSWGTFVFAPPRWPGKRAGGESSHLGEAREPSASGRPPT
jgi:hypothetical protein